MNEKRSTEFGPCRIFDIDRLPVEIADRNVFGMFTERHMRMTKTFAHRHFNHNLSLVGKRRIAFTVLRRDWLAIDLIKSFGLSKMEITEEDFYQILKYDSDCRPDTVLATNGIPNLFFIYGFLNHLYLVCIRMESKYWHIDSFDIRSHLRIPKGSRLFFLNNH